MTLSPSEIAEQARRARPRTPRWLWMVAGAVGIGCAIAFAFALVTGGDPPARAVQPAEVRGPGDRGLGFGVGLVLGLATGVAIGLAIARQLGVHSSRSRP